MSGYNYLVRFLDSEGFRKNEDGRVISFRYEGTTFLTFKQETSYLQVVLVLKAEGYSRLKMLEACNKFNDDKYVVKFVAHDNTIWCSYEFEPNENTSNADFDLIFRLLDKVSDEIYEELEKN